MIDLVIASLDLVKGIKECDLIIVCDRMKVIQPDKKTNWKSGKVNNDYQLKYEEYIEKLRRKYIVSDESVDKTSAIDTDKVQTDRRLSPSFNEADEVNRGKLMVE